jgi:uncharacterized membrane protein
LGGKRTFRATSGKLAGNNQEVAMRWFRPAGFFFVPVSALGWLTSALAIAFCAQVFWFVDSHSHSVSDTLYGVFPFWVPTLLALAWIADRTGARASQTS